MDGKIWLLIFGVIILIAALLVHPSSENNTNIITALKGKSNTTQSDDFKRCGMGNQFRCMMTSQGTLYDPDNPPPTVCGCAPTTCPIGYGLLVGIAEGNWPDGSRKGMFSCTNEWPP
ncbi:hypothetical protein KW805_03745 [Candidatus Pacearchaeota archaeon]|nr:hypothetical protein [Candidatus Pacearchaeota archaeon]